AGTFAHELPSLPASEREESHGKPRPLESCGVSVRSDRFHCFGDPDLIKSSLHGNGLVLRNPTCDWCAGKQKKGGE
uniref:Uncharacterized protein n=1 Tax=Anopheles atroparvus TaxID=41427 RepID=A0AAG5DMS6_ANOAO